MALTGWSTSNYLSRAAATNGGDWPFAISVWGWSPSSSDSRAMCVVGVSGTLTHYQMLALRNVDPGTIRSAEASTGTAANAYSTAAITNESWFHGFSTFVSNGSRSAYLGGSSRGDNTSGISVTFASQDITTIGMHPSPTAAWPATGGLAEVSIWSLADMTEANRDSLASLLATPVSGEAPNALEVNEQAGQPWEGKLLAYWPLRTATDLDDASGNGHHLSMTGTLTTFASHPPVAEIAAGLVAHATIAYYRALMGQ
jgi:hypothetical protein